MLPSTFRAVQTVKAIQNACQAAICEAQKRHWDADAMRQIEKCKNIP